jgi:hypothetical protein
MVAGILMSIAEYEGGIGRTTLCRYLAESDED